jgi:hypothetical protein
MRSTLSLSELSCAKFGLRGLLFRRNPEPGLLKRKRSRPKYDHWALGLTNCNRPSLSSLRSPVQNSVFASSCLGATREPGLLKKKAIKVQIWPLGPRTNQLQSPFSEFSAISCSKFCLRGLQFRRNPEPGLLKKKAIMVQI